MFERFTRNARAVVVGAQQSAVQASAPEVRPAHLLESLVATDAILAMQVLAELGAPGDEVRRVVRGLVTHYADGLDADDAEALKLLGIDLDEVISRIDSDLSDGRGPIPKGHKPFARAEQEGARAVAPRGARAWGTASSAPSTSCSASCARTTTCAQTLEAFDLTPDDVRRAVDEADRRAG